MPRPGSRPDYVVANECLSMLNHAETNIISAVRRYYPEDSPEIYGDLVKALEKVHRVRINVLTLKKKMRKRNNTIKKYKKIIIAFNKENERIPPLPEKFFDIESVAEKKGKAFLVDLEDEDEVIQVLKK